MAQLTWIVIALILLGAFAASLTEPVPIEPGLMIRGQDPSTPVMDRGYILLPARQR